MPDQPAPDFEEAREVSAEIIAGQRMTMTGPRWMTMYEQKLLAETVDALFSEREAREEELDGDDARVLAGTLRMANETADRLLIEREALRRALGAYAVTLRSGERESPQIRALYDAALPATESAQAEQPTSEAGS